MNKIYQVYQVSDSTGETLDRIFLALKAQFSNFECKTIHYSFTRTKNQIDKMVQESEKLISGKEVNDKEKYILSYKLDTLKGIRQ